MLLGATIRLKDQFSPVLKEIKQETRGFESKLKIMNKMVVRPVVRIKDDATRQIGRIKNSLLSLHGIAAMALGAMGMHQLGQATLGQAMAFETQMVSMEHWLKGNKKLAQETVAWLNEFAAATPFEMGDLFPAMTRAIGLGGGDITQAKKMVKLAADMAALTPGKTVQDAMEALADAQVGEFERMKEFSMKVTQEQMKAWGGFEGFITKAQERFAGGSAKLSQTSIGLLSTITDNIKTLFREAGVGALDALKPRLAKITKWFDENKATVQRWKDNLVRLGRDTFEGILSRAETFLGRLRDRFRDPEFAKLDWSGKLSALLDGAITGAQNWIAGPGGQKLTEMGLSMGAALGKGVLQSFGAVLAEHPVLRTALMSYAGWKVGGIWGAGVGVTGSVAMEIPRQAYKVGEAVEAYRMRDFWSFKAGYEQLERTPAGQPMIKGGELRSGGHRAGLGLQPRGHASGLPYVPYDNYLAVLHRGERVLTAAEARQYRGGGPAINITIPKLADQINASNPADVDRLLDKLEERLLQVSFNMG